MTRPPSDPARYDDGPTVARGAIGGFLMGLANLVPGISGGTMLLAVGVYPHFIRGVAEITTFRFTGRTLLLLGSVAAGALVAIFALAGIVGELVIHQRWTMYSLFIGLTLGGVPVLWRMLRRADLTVVITSLGGIAAMAALASITPGSSPAGGTGGPAYILLFVAGIAGASAMILPGVSGGYVLLILGQYVTILAAIEAIRGGVSSRDWAHVGEAMHILVPVLLGIGLGVVVVSNLIKMLLARFPRATLGFLLGLLLGAVLGLWPYREAIEPAVGDIIKGVEILTPEMAAEVEPKDWSTQPFTPAPLQVLGSLGLIVAGFTLSTAVSRLGRTTADPHG